jgi:plasmid stabilization system protein ParE
MTVTMLAAAEADLDEAFEFYESKQEHLGAELVAEFRRAVDRIITFPQGWRALDETYRRCKIHRFPYGVVYKVAGDIIIITAVAHLSREPFWQDRDV